MRKASFSSSIRIFQPFPGVLNNPIFRFLSVPIIASTTLAHTGKFDTPSRSNPKSIFY